MFPLKFNSLSNIKLSKVSITEKKEYLELHNYKCSCCNIRFEKYMYVVKLPSENVIIMCKFCNAINNPFYSISNQEIIICESNMKQMDIINSTIKFVKKNKKIPTIYDIDPDSKYVNISPVEYIALKNDHKLKAFKLISNFKIFYTYFFDVSYLTGKKFYNFENFDFDDNDDINSTDSPEIDIDAELNNSNNNKSKNLSTFFDHNNSKIKHNIQSLIFDIN